MTAHDEIQGWAMLAGIFAAAVIAVNTSDTGTLTDIATVALGALTGGSTAKSLIKLHRMY